MGKKVVSVIPVLHALPSNISRQLYSTMAFTYQNHSVILAGCRTKDEHGVWIEDRTWEGIPNDVLEWGGLDLTQEWRDLENYEELSDRVQGVRVKEGTRLTIMEVQVKDVWNKRKKVYEQKKRRTTNIQRTCASWFVIKEYGAEVLAMSDGKIRRPPNYIEVGLELMERHNVGAVAGEVTALVEGDHWINDLDSKKGMPFQRFPNFKKGYIWDRKKSGKVRTGPVLASIMILVIEFVLRMIEWDQDAEISYEDFFSDVGFVMRKGLFWVTGDERFKVEHNHRKSVKSKYFEWSRSGAAAFQMLQKYGLEPFPMRRLIDVLVVLVALLFGLIAVAAPILANQPKFLVTEIVFGLMVYFSYGILTVSRIRKWYAFFFPFIAGTLILTFVWNYIREALLHDGAGRLFQSIWIVFVYVILRGLT